MRLLPRTPRGIWLLAAAIWAAACTVAWLVLPIRPRAEWATDSPMLPVGFVPGRRTLVCGTVLGGDAGRGETLGPLRFFDADSGQVGEWFEAGEEVRLRASALSPDGRWAAVCHGRGGTFRLQLFDIATGQPRTDLLH